MNRQRLLVLALAFAGVAIIAALLLMPRRAGAATLSGYIEGEALYPAAPVSGRIVEIHVRRGDRVEKGQPLFAVDPAQLAAARDQAAADLASAQALAADARRGQRKPELDVIRADIAAAEAQLAEASKTLTRTRTLAAAGAASKASLEAAQSAFDTASAQRVAALRRLDVAELGGRKDQIASADERVRQAQAALAAATAHLADLAQSAPAAGRIEDVYYQLGEWAPANQPLLSLIPDDRLRVRFFVPEPQLTNWPVGARIAFGCAGCPAGLTARVSYVSPRPEFTPPVIYSREARDRMVFMAEAIPDAPPATTAVAPRVSLTPGLPVDVSPSPNGAAAKPSDAPKISAVEPARRIGQPQ